MRKFKGNIRIAAFYVLLITVLFAGCKEKPVADQGKSEENNAAADQAETGNAAEYSELAVGDAAPDFEVELLDGTTLKLSDCQGQPVFLNFWATWCPPCIAEMPDIQKLYEAYSDKAVILAIDVGETKDTVSSFIEEKGYTFNIGLDENLEIGKKYPTDGIPYTVVINGEGIITSIHLGGGTGMLPVFEEDMQAALAE